MIVDDVLLPDPVAAGQALLDDFIAVYKTLAPEGVELPDRQGFVPGDVVPWDGPELVLNFMGMGRGQPTSTVAAQTSPLIPQETILYYEFRLTLLREVTVPTGKGNPPRLPSIAKLSDDYVTIATDTALVARTMNQLHASYRIVPAGIPFGWGPVAPLGPEGGLAGNVCPVTFQAGQNLQREY